VDGLVEMAGALLSIAHDIFGPGVCPGDWVWATTTAGVIIALIPTLGLLAVALIRKGTGNNYSAVTLGVFGVIGFVTAFVLPWLYVSGMSRVFHNAARPELGGATGLSPDELQTLPQGQCWIPSQAEYLGTRPNVYEVLFHPFESTPVYLLRLGALVGLPALALLFTMLQARAALRRGPKWPGRLFWIPFVVMVVLTAPVEANVATHMWLGYLPASVLGLVPVLLVGAPRWSVIEQSYKSGDGAGGPGGTPARQQQPPPYVPPYQPPPQPPRPQPQQLRPATPPVRVNPVPPVMPRQPEPDRAALGRLAADPGPLPGARREQATSVWQQSGGRFQKVKRLGTGGFGTVWLALDTKLDRTVAVKIAHAPDAETEERMVREARALAAVHHPNCVRVYDIVADVDGLGLVMEYIEGEPLVEAVATHGMLDDVRAARLWLTMAGALSAAHDKGVLHRDVKPANVIVDPAGNPHLIDFGIARTKGDRTLTAAGMMVGTPDYLAPETASGAAATPSSDAWQVAATVSFALTGHPPRGARENAMAALMAAARAEPLSRLARHSAHARLLAASMDTDPMRRPTLNAVVREMTNWLNRAGAEQHGPVTQLVRLDDDDRTRPSGDSARPSGDSTRRI